MKHHSENQNETKAPKKQWSQPQLSELSVSETATDPTGSPGDGTGSSTAPS